MALKKCKECGYNISSTSKVCPKCGAKQNNGFSLMEFIFLCLIIGVAFSYVIGEHTPPEPPKPAPKIEQQQAPQVKLLAKTCKRSGDWFIVEGEVQNVSGKPLKNVLATAIFRDKDGVFVSSHESLISYTTLLKGQTSPFKVMETYNPVSVLCEVEFHLMFGGK